MHVRVDRQGTLLKDYHTAGDGVFRGSRDYFAPTSSGGKGKNPVVTERHYLQDASFLVALEGENELLHQLASALIDPAWPLALGRKSCPPAEPVLIAILERDARAALAQHPLQLHRRHLPLAWSDDAWRFTPDLSAQNIRFVFECGPNDPGAQMRRDVPVTWADRLDRQYTVRFVRDEIRPLTPEVIP
jgi:CRISPR system Cascade subunit CasD